MTPPFSTAPETTSWQTLLALDQKSNDFTHLARQLLSDQRNRGSGVPQFTEEEATELIELLEPTILQHPDIPGDLKSCAFSILRKLCGMFDAVPRTCLIDEDFKIQDEMPFATRGYTDLWERCWNGRKVAVKALRFNPDDDQSKITKRFCKEVVLWKRLNHPNILPFHGASFKANRFCMVSQWMENGNILNYTSKHPEANRLQLLINVASGLKYLHQASLVHGNVRGSNILISNNQPPLALLGDFGLNAIIFDPFSFTRASINWTAPELLAPDIAHYQPSPWSDIYALGMVIYEVLTGASPFSGTRKRELVCKVVEKEERPQRPRDSEKLGLTDKIWEVLQKCWVKEPSARPPIELVSASLKQVAEAWVVDVPAFLLASKPGVERVMGMKEDQARDFATKLDERLNQIGISQVSGRQYLKHLQRLCCASGVLPASFTLADDLDDIEERSFASGGFSDLYRATYKGKRVVVKILKTTNKDDLENVQKRFVNEVVGWKWLRHQNILPFVGVSSTPSPFSMVSEWMENGDIMNFVNTTPDRNPFSLLVDVTNGLQYLHQHDVVHGDLKGANILINSECRACLADFGLVTIVGETSSVEGLSSSQKPGGTIRWMAPEILLPGKYGYVKRARRKLPSKGTDVYAFGMTILEVMTGRKPFESTTDDTAVVKEVLGGTRPDRPAEGFSEALWTLLNQTWLEEFESSNSPSARPNTVHILERLRVEERNWSPTSRPLAPPVPAERETSTDISAKYLGLLDQISGDAGDDEDDTPGGLELNADDILIGRLVGSEPTADDWSVMDVDSAPFSLSSLPKKRGVRKAWRESKKFMKKFWRRKTPPKLSDKLVPEREEVKWYAVLFSAPQKANTGK